MTQHRIEERVETPEALKPGRTEAQPQRAIGTPMVLALQRTAGNQAVSRALQRSAQQVRVQRVKVDGSFDENILQPYDDKNKPTKALTPHVYSQDVHYDLTRSPTSVDVTVKIRFVSPDGTAIPSGDSARRDYINRMMTGIQAAWANKYEFVSVQKPAPAPSGGPTPTPAPSPGGSSPPPAPAVTPNPAPGTSAPPAPIPVRLPVVFKAVPEYATSGGGDMPTVNVHPITEAADYKTPGKRIDSGNWFPNEGNYGAGLTGADAEAAQAKTAAHEYGHLLGIPDEYSQSAGDMHKLMHQASPTLSAGQDNQLDDTARKWMVLTAMRPALMRHAKAGAVKATAAVGKQRPNLERELRASLAGLWSEAASLTGLSTKITTQLTTGGHGALGTKVVAALQHEGAGLDTGRIAGQAVKNAISLGSIRGLMETALDSAIAKAQTVVIPITNDAGQNKSMTITISTSKTVDTAAAKGPLATASEKVATATMDAGQGKGGAAPPALRPGGSFVSELQALTGGWNAPNTLATQAGAIKGKTAGEYDSWGHDATTVTDESALATFARSVVETISVSLAGEAINDFLSTTFAGLMQGQVDAIAGVVQAEIDTHRTATPSGTNAASVAAPDPRVAAAVNAVNAKMKSLQEDPGKAVPSAKRTGAAADPTTQHTSYSVVSQMGSANEGGMRTDYMSGILAKFNATLKKTDEDPFKTEAKT